MRVHNNFDLTRYNSLRLQCVASELYVPESYEDLTALLASLKQRKQNFYLLSSGSNVLLKRHIKTPVIYLMELDKTLCFDKESNTVVAGASLKIQTLINFLADNNLGGIEYLYSLPASVGGCVCMNAGRARERNLSISDFITSVEYFDDGVLKTVDKSCCQFGYRKSIFQQPGKIVTKVFFQFPYQEKMITKQKIKERSAYVKTCQDPGKPSLGSIFSTADSRIMGKVKGIRIGGATFSKRTSNWISNLGNARYWQVIALIKMVECVSLFRGKKARLEVKKWKK